MELKSILEDLDCHMNHLNDVYLNEIFKLQEFYSNQYWEPINEFESMLIGTASGSHPITMQQVNEKIKSSLVFLDRQSQNNLTIRCLPVVNGSKLLGLILYILTCQLLVSVILVILHLAFKSAV